MNGFVYGKITIFINFSIRITTKHLSVVKHKQSLPILIYFAQIVRGFKCPSPAIAECCHYFFHCTVILSFSISV